jgi:chromosome segregation ATPase
VSEIQITDNQLFEIIGRKEVEIYSKDRELDAYRTSLETTKGLATEVIALRAAKPALELSNKQLAEKNIELDRALTEARKERDAVKGELANSATALANKSRETEATKVELDVANAALKKSRDDYTTLQCTCDDLQKEIDTLKAAKKKSHR